ncbi:MAG: LamG-like jellyroll fold domain-containing protein [Flavobacteriales bacterium]
MTSTGSISVWCKRSAVSNTGSGFLYNPVFLAKNTRDLYSTFIEGAALYVQTNNNKIFTITTSSTPTEKYTSTATTVSNGNWYHLVMTWDYSSLKLYVNGVQEGGTIAKNFTSTFSNTKKAILGATQDQTNNRFFNDVIDDLAIYNRVLTSQEITDLYNEADYATSTNEITSNSSISLFPNPTSEQLTINLGSLENSMLKVYSINGALMSIQNAVSGSTSVDVSSNASGVYFTEVSNNSQTFRNKFVVE